MNRFSKNGDGKDRIPNERITSHQDGHQPVHPDNQHEQQIIKALTGRYDEIESLWKQAEEDLKRFRIPHAVRHCYFTDDRGEPYYHYYLSFVKYGKGWRICHSKYEEYQTCDDHDHECDCTPIIECPLELRIAMMSEFENLRKKVVEEAGTTVPKLDEAISSFRKILNG